MSGPTAAGGAGRPALVQTRWTVGLLPSFADVRAHYLKTLLGTQLLTAFICVAVVFKTGSLIAALAFFVMMQLGAVLGAAWGARLKNKLERDARRRRVQS